MDKPTCYSCQIEISSYYCTCSQSYICENCVAYHQRPTCCIANLDLDITSQIIDTNSSLLSNDSFFDVRSSFNPSISETVSFISYIDELIASVNAHKKVYIDFLEKNPEIDKIITNNPNLIKFNLNYEEEKIQSIISNKSKLSATAQSINPQYFFYTLFDFIDQTKLVKVDMETFICEKEIEISKNVFTCCWIIHTGNSVYLIGLYERSVKVVDIIKIDLETGEVKKFDIFNNTLTGYSCVLYNNYIYFIGGRKTQKLKRIAQNTVSIFDTTTDSIIDYKFELKVQRYNTCAFIHNDKLYVTSENVVKTIEIFDLKSYPLKSEVKNIELIAGLSCGMVSYKNWVYFFNNDKIGRFNESLEIEILQSKMIISQNLWNFNMMPICFNDKIYFFGKEKIIEYNVETNCYTEKGIYMKNGLLEQTIG
ncbi:hypothetical protein SteCoe_10543 [Stentor coeruleus]|uniref:Uncharacterized protein n=1 Tax=Stentor coeruleus TaxID=5963 RepID=A0A1R2CFA4_9CILI|nr:hypothetical protein SteCoe_10543 [Stentor coeruleus]